MKEQTQVSVERVVSRGLAGVWCSRPVLLLSCAASADGSAAPEQVSRTVLRYHGVLSCLRSS
jgi:hypothetical protein